MYFNGIFLFSFSGMTYVPRISREYTPEVKHTLVAKLCDIVLIGYCDYLGPSRHKILKVSVLIV